MISYNLLQELFSRYNRSCVLRLRNKFIWHHVLIYWLSPKCYILFAYILVFVNFYMTKIYFYKAKQNFQIHLSTCMGLWGYVEHSHSKVFTEYFRRAPHHYMNSQ